MEITAKTTKQSHMVTTEQNILTTTFEALDSIIEGFHCGSLISLAGRPCMRMEYFTYTMMRNWMRDEATDEGFVFFSLLEKRETIAKRLGFQKEDEVAGCIVESHLRGMELTTLCEKIRQYIWKEHKKVFVIDNFNMIDARGYKDLHQERYCIARELCKLAHELDIILIVDAMLFSYYIEEREGIDAKHPCLADLGYEGMSGDLDVFSDVVLSFWSPEKYHIYLNERGEDLHNVVEVEVLKNVNDDASEGKTVTLYMDKRVGRLY